MFVHEVMTATPETADPTWTVRRALHAMLAGEFRHLPVVSEQGALLGMLSERDIRAHLLPVITEYEQPEEAKRMMARHVSEVMSSDVISVEAHAEVEEAIDLMIERRIGALPVVELSTGDLVGIVSYIDVLRAARALF